MTIRQLLTLAENVLGGAVSTSDLATMFGGATLSNLNDAVDAVNNFFLNGREPDNLNFECPPPTP